MSLSWGYTESFFFPDLQHTTIPLSAAADVFLNAFNTGQLALASMGNDNDHFHVWPASFEKRVVAIGAVAPNGNRWQDASFYPESSFQRGSDYGSWIDFATPGGVWMIAPNFAPSGYFDLSDCGYYSGTWFSGTSAACPVASGVAGLIQSARPTLLGEDIFEIMKRTATDIGLTGFDDSTGYGLPSAPAAIQYLAPATKVHIHGTIGAYGSMGSLAVRDSTVVTRTFTNVPGIADGTYANVVRYRLYGKATYSAGFSGAPDAWARSSGTVGWPDDSAFDYDKDVNVATILPGSVTATRCSLQTIVYRVPSVGWFPVPPESARAAFTALGTSSLVGTDPAMGPTPFAFSVAPNPMTDATRISFDSRTRQRVRVDIVSLSGRLIRTLADQIVPPGVMQLSWNGTDNGGRRCSSGIYFCRVVSSQGEARRKLTLVTGSRP